MAERRHGLREDLFAVGDEEETRSRQFLAEARVVDRRHDRLAGAGRRDEQIAVMAAAAGQCDLLEQPLLERLRSQFDRAQREFRERPPLALVRARNCSRSYGMKSPLCQ